MTALSYIRGSTPKASITFGNQTYNEDEKGFIAIPTEFVPVAVSHGFTVVPDPYFVHKVPEAPKAPKALEAVLENEKKDHLIYLV